jgi:hypothetical protein
MKLFNDRKNDRAAKNKEGTRQKLTKSCNNRQGQKKLLICVTGTRYLSLLKTGTVHCYQCCGSGSESGSTGSTCFWASRIRILLWIRIRILLSSCKNSKKNLDSYYLVTLFDFLSLKNDVNVASKK